MPDPERTNPRYWMSVAEIPKRFHSVDFDDYDPALGNKKAHRYAVELDAALATGDCSTGRGITFNGPPGRGKTMLAAILCRRHLLRNPPASLMALDDYAPPVRFTTLHRYQRLLHDLIRNGGDRPSVFVDVDLLVIDDVGKERASKVKHIEREFEALVRERFDLGRPTILTTNLSATLMASAYGDSLYSLLYESSYLVAMPGDDLRRAHAAR
jgi:DNA replication protein DnaC